MLSAGATRPGLMH